ncbi:RNA polymerase sigma factor [Streptomyces griseoluteus]|uniref:RNA polymerase sigma factor n=1 Tax=Streptomyces griseoluteus TaxID=29306 RepID=UPI00340D88AF
MSSQANATIITPEAVTELAARASAGDRDAFATLYNGHRGMVFSYLVTRTRSRVLAEDLTSETFARALASIDRFSENAASGGFGGWLYRIARNLHIDHVRKLSTRMEAPTLLTSFENTATGSSEVLERSAESTTLRELDLVDVAATLDVALAAITPVQRECLRLRYVEGLTLQETAVRMGKRIGAIKTLAFRGLAGARTALTTEDVAA